MSKDKKFLFISVSFGEKGTIYGSGHALDTFLYAHDLDTEGDLFLNCGLSEVEFETEQQVLKDWDYSLYLRNGLNDGTIPIYALRLIHGKHKDDADNKHLLLGDYLELEKPEIFKQLIQAYKDKIKEQLAEDPEELPRDLYKEIQNAKDQCDDYYRNEWLNGNRNGEGVLNELSKKLFAERGLVQWNQEKDSVDFTLEEDDVRELYGYDLGEDKPIPDSKEIEKYLYDMTLYKASQRTIDEKRKQAIRKEEKERTEAHRALQAIKEKEEKLSEAKKRYAKLQK